MDFLEWIGVRWGCFRFIVIMSAFLFCSMLPEFIWRAFAALVVAMSRICWEGAFVGLVCLCRSAQNFISSNMSRLLFEAALSVPREMFIFCSCIFLRGRVPLDSFMLEVGQWRMFTLFFAKIWISFSVKWME